MVVKTVNMYSPNGILYVVNESDISDYKAKGYTQRKKNADKAEKSSSKSKEKAEKTTSEE